MMKTQLIDQQCINTIRTLRSQGSSSSGRPMPMKWWKPGG